MELRTKAVIEKVAREFNLPVAVIQAAAESQFQCAREATKSGTSGIPSTFKNVRFPNLGLLVALDWKVKMLHERKHRKTLTVPNNK